MALPSWEKKKPLFRCKSEPRCAATHRLVYRCVLELGHGRTHLATNQAGAVVREWSDVDVAESSAVRSGYEHEEKAHM